MKGARPFTPEEIQALSQSFPDGQGDDAFNAQNRCEYGVFCNE